MESLEINLIDFLTHGASVFQGSTRWMGWNLFLALIPLGLSGWLFRSSRHVSLLWGLGVAAFVGFLPNAPYVLTDIIHLIRAIQNNHPLWVVTLVLIPQYLLFILMGFESYVLSLLSVERWLRQRGHRWAVVWTTLLLHGLSAVGIYLGRFDRFNTWDLLTRPQSILATLANNLTTERSLLIILIFTIVITLLYEVMKQVTLGLACRIRHYRRRAMG
ncbi:DUF1361 domain-containing protein [Thermoleptolyngbya sp. C42_A2020_037]|uniref:DUF1361 domain-containing protein n=1 Tax=Thermoleptolyngbya sp. C42_A2020_037 TaxID=2747799 RepID=UPI0019E93C5D|nr:DUF1361 domain-containing protein [Thermoleptolyngbya sp. C42_A2020_037]MBF2084099.1 DUF1361 domain-containing protein [Thermoleptolyngbya sp. C42_A2020_037]